MGFHRKKLEEKCNKCNTNLELVHLKNPFIDDFLEECPECGGDAERVLMANTRRQARREEEWE